MTTAFHLLRSTHIFCVINTYQCFRLDLVFLRLSGPLPTLFFTPPKHPLFYICHYLFYYASTLSYLTVNCPSFSQHFESSYCHCIESTFVLLLNLTPSLSHLYLIIYCPSLCLNILHYS